MSRAELQGYGYTVSRDVILHGGYVAMQGVRLVAATDTEASAWDAAAADCESDSAGPCPKCNSTDTEFHNGSTGCGLDVTYRECNACTLQWDQT